jgi:integrase
MSIRKRTWKTANGEERQSWVVDYVDQHGKRRLKTFEKKKDADTFSTTAKFEVREGTHTADSASITVGAAADLWLTSCRANGLEKSTLAAYEQHVLIHIKPFLGRTKLSQLTAPMVRELEDRLRAGTPAPGEEQGRARSPAMIRKILVSLGSLVADAQERGLVSRNVVRDRRARAKKGKERQAIRRQKGKLKIGVDIPSPTEIRAIVDHLSGRWRPLILTAIFTGLRASELRGLRWIDVDLKKNELHVRQRADRYSQIGRPKSEAGERSIPLPPMAANALRQWKLISPKSELGLAFPTTRGKIEHHKNIVERGFIPVQIAAGVTKPVVGSNGQPMRDKDGAPVLTARYTGLHALRHFYASWSINRKADGGLELPPKVIQERLGHSTIAMTMDVYGHLFPRGDDSAELAVAEKSLLGIV